MLLFTLAYWHSLAKLRMHTDTSLRLLDGATTVLGETLRQFKSVTCADFATKESAAEYSRRVRNHTRLVNKGLASAESSPSGRHPRTLNLNTPKTHFLGDYASSIPLVGTTDSISTQQVCVCHLRPVRVPLLVTLHPLFRGNSSTAT